MLKENIKTIRKAKGLSQEELAIKLNVVRQTISKWEQGLSVPDADMLISLAEVLAVPVNTLLGETVTEANADDLKMIAEKLEIINLQLANEKATKRRIRHLFFISSCVITVVVLAVLILLGSAYTNWDYHNPETAVIGTIYHSFEWLYIRIFPFVFLSALVGVYLTRRKA